MAGKWRFIPAELLATCGGRFCAFWPHLTHHRHLPRHLLGELHQPSTRTAPPVVLSASLILSSFNLTNVLQVIEIESDKKMNRTLARPLASGRMGRTHATVFGITTGVVGVAALALFTNPMATSLVRLSPSIYFPMVCTLTRSIYRLLRISFSTLQSIHRLRRLRC